MKGIMMLASPDWLVYHQLHSANKRVVFYGSLKKETHGFDYLFCVSKNPRRLVAAGKIQKQHVIHQDQAWAHYLGDLGAPSEGEWRRQAEVVLTNSQNNYGGKILAIELSDFRFFQQPITFDSVGIQNTPWQQKKKVEAGATANLIKMLEGYSEADLVLALEFGLNPNEKTFVKGKEYMRQHLAKERNQDLVAAAKQFWQKISDGNLQCEVCKFSFRETYGQIGAGFVEAHHRVSIASLNTVATTKIADLAPVCSNCHRMLHRHQPMLSIETLRQIIAEQKSELPPVDSTPSE